MFNLNGNTLTIQVQAPQENGKEPMRAESVAGKIQGSSYLFDPQAIPVPPTLPHASIVASGKPGMVVQTFFQMRKENTPLENKRGETVYCVELFESQNLGSEEEFQDSLHQEMEEREECDKEEEEGLDESLSSEESPLETFDGGFHEGEEQERELSVLDQEDLTSQRAKKMWKLTRKALAEELKKARKTPVVSRAPDESICYLALLSKKKPFVSFDQGGRRWF